MESNRGRKNSLPSSSRNELVLFHFLWAICDLETTREIASLQSDFKRHSLLILFGPAELRMFKFLISDKSQPYLILAD